MRLYSFLLFTLLSFMLKAQTHQSSIVALSQQILLAAKTGEPSDSLQRLLQQAPFSELKAQLKTDDEKKTFWLNIYNAYTQLLLQKNPEAYKSRNKFFKSKQILIAGKSFSLDFIEHGILRRSQIKLGLGYIRKPFPSFLEKSLRVQQPDYRVHFALNCGAKSCPPIAFYDTAKIDEQLLLAQKSFLKNDLVFDKEKNEVEISKIFSWFRGDFNGKKGIVKLLKEQKLIPVNVKPKVRFRKYDWSLALNTYKD